MQHMKCNLILQDWCHLDSSFFFFLDLIEQIRKVFNPSFYSRCVIFLICCYGVNLILSQQFKAPSSGQQVHTISDCRDSTVFELEGQRVLLSAWFCSSMFALYPNNV